MKRINLQVITPEKIFFKGDVISVTVKGSEGYLGIYYDHTPLVTPLLPGVLSIRCGEEEIKKASMAQGLVEVRPEKVIVLIDAVEWPEEIDIERAQKARERAEKRLEQSDKNIDVLRVRLALQRSLTRIRIAKSLRNG